MSASLLDASSRVALAALLHDLGKFAERAGVFAKHPDWEAHLQTYCPHRKAFTDAVGRFSHHHAAHSALAIDSIEEWLPDLIRGDMTPFASRGQGGEITDSLINAAAMHHKPGTFLQWIIATADRVASGFEREDFDQYNEGEEKTATGKNHYQARQLTLFEQMRFDPAALKHVTPESLKYRYPLKPLSPESIFPVLRDGYEPGENGPAKAEYAALWEQFVAGLEDLEDIHLSHRKNWPLWLDHFDSLWLTFTHAIPSATAFGAKPDVSLYDHSKAVAALATALWRWHDANDRCDAAATSALKDRSDWDEKKFMLVQGDFFGIQDFIFAAGRQTNKHAAKLMRGRSFYVSLLTEMAALKILDALDLPPTSQIVNAAGKFLIVAPATEDARVKLEQVEREINAWFLKHSFGEAGIGLALLPACCNDFLKRHKESGKRNFTGLMKDLFEQLELAKLQRMNLCGAEAPAAVFAGALERYANGACELNGKLPADADGRSNLSADQVKIGETLTKQTRLLVTRKTLNHNTLKLDIFGYHAQFTADEEETGKFGKDAESGNLLRAWDFSMAERGKGDSMLWNGYARRNINGYAPRFDAQALEWESRKYGKFEAEIDFDPIRNTLKTLNHIACEDRKSLEGDLNKWQGQAALMTLKGDIDNLGTLFQQGYAEPTFAKMAALSRQINAFFAVWLPWYCAEKYPNTYTVFAGGDDFFLIGPWHSTLKLAQAMREKFTHYVAGNADITYSAGLVMSKPGKPIRHLADSAEAALAAAKAFPRTKPAIVGSAALEPTYHAEAMGTAAAKNAVCAYGHTVSWDDFSSLLAASENLDRLLADHNLSMGYRYGLLHLADRAASNKPEDAIWCSQLAYRTRRLVDKLRDKGSAQRVQTELITEIREKGIAKFKGAYKIALFTHLYQYRD
ncbi:MAG: type III-A CRISPR-associated protein Cas10/Csm1 [Sulfurimicrobium sp.]|nr:type III-A CRISPR-associated protein Cas10/Csm1 [Sulfurimicrobium sp.]